MINSSNYASKDNPHPPLAPVPRPRLPGGATVMGRPGASPAGTRILDRLILAARVALDWLAYFVRRRADRWYAMNDTEAYWRGWQIAKAHGGLGRRYRDCRFDTLAACARCAGAGVRAEAPCGPCLGTGRVTLGEVG